MPHSRLWPPRRRKDGRRRVSEADDVVNLHFRALCRCRLRRASAVSGRPLGLAVKKTPPHRTAPSLCYALMHPIRARGRADSIITSSFCSGAFCARLARDLFIHSPAVVIRFPRILAPRRWNEWVCDYASSILGRLMIMGRGRDSNKFFQGSQIFFICVRAESV